MKTYLTFDLLVFLLRFETLPLFPKFNRLDKQYYFGETKENILIENLIKYVISIINIESSSRINIFTATQSIEQPVTLSLQTETLKMSILKYKYKYLLMYMFYLIE